MGLSFFFFKSNPLRCQKNSLKRLFELFMNRHPYNHHRVLGRASRPGTTAVLTTVAAPDDYKQLLTKDDLNYYCHKVVYIKHNDLGVASHLVLRHLLFHYR